MAPVISVESCANTEMVTNGMASPLVSITLPVIVSAFIIPVETITIIKQKNTFFISIVK